MKRAIVLLAYLATACGSAKIEPVDIRSDDMCSFCRMAISERRFAAEFWSREATLFKFDDTACMVSFIKKHPAHRDILAGFVVDFESRRWLKAEDAWYVRSAQIKTPMGGGVIAFGDRAGAQAAASRYQGTTLRYEGLFR